jgi:putative membrane protein
MMPANAATHLKPLDTGTQLAEERTWLAQERTLMAWIRTSTSLICFGFTIYKFFETEAARSAVSAHRLINPREFAMMMIGTGLVALALSTYDHHRNLKHVPDVPNAAHATAAGVVAALVSVMGVVAFLSALFRA